GPSSGPSRGLMAGFAEDPCTDVGDEPSVLGDRNEFIRPDEAETWSLPANQRLQPSYEPGVGRDDRLIVKPQFIPWDGMSQGMLERELRGDPALHCRVEELVTIS